MSEDNILQKILGYFYKEPSGELRGKEGLKLASLLYTNAIDYVEKNGLTYYGIVCLADKEGMLEMLEDEDILSVVAQECD